MMVTPTFPKEFKDPRALAGLPADAPIAVALSGGADSVALLAMLADSGRVTAVHVHHGIRGAEADRDERFCRETAAALGVPFVALHVDAPALAKEKKISLETAAREARYLVLTEYLAANGIPLLVTAHHADDQLETVLQHLLRGSGLAGLCGIPACRALAKGIFVARPLLQVTRDELREYLAARGLSFVTDSTNEEECCTRNYLRLSVLPALAERYPAAAKSAARCAATLAEDEAYLGSLAGEFLQHEGSAPRLAELASLPAPVFARVMRRLLPVTPEQVHLAALRQFCQAAKRHASLSLPHCTVHERSGHLAVETEKDAATEDYLLVLHKGENPIPAVGGMAVLTDSAEFCVSFPENLYKYNTYLSLSSATIKGELRVRPRRAGDRILTKGMHKAVRRLAELSALPPAVRARMPLLVDDEGIVAVPFAAVRDGAAINADITVHIAFQ